MHCAPVSGAHFLEPALASRVGSVAALDHFWAEPETERRAIWGPPVDPEAPFVGFDFDRVTDEELGLALLG